MSSLSKINAWVIIELSIIVVMLVQGESVEEILKHTKRMLVQVNLVEKTIDIPIVAKELLEQMASELQNSNFPIC